MKTMTNDVCSFFTLNAFYDVLLRVAECKKNALFANLIIAEVGLSIDKWWECHLMIIYLYTFHFGVYFR